MSTTIFLLIARRALMNLSNEYANQSRALNTIPSIARLIAFYGLKVSGSVPKGPVSFGFRQRRCWTYVPRTLYMNKRL